MKYLDLTLPGPAANLALDEALLDLAEAGQLEEVLRIWEPQTHFMVAGFSNRLSREIILEACRDEKIPVLRRCSGGGAVLQGPGCLNYSLVLRVRKDPLLSSVTGTNQLVMEKHRQALEKVLEGPVEIQGHTDLAMRGRKFSGNAQRRRKDFLLFHGAFLLNLDLSLMARVLAMPSKQPEYRQGRPHLEFVKNLALSPAVLIGALQEAWEAREPLGQPVPGLSVARLIKEKYSNEKWNFRWG
jgi:lipoate---protein ligase